VAQRERKRIALLHYAAPPVVGGVETTLAHHARLLAQDGHRVRLIAGRGRAWDSSIEVRCTRLADSRSPEIVTARAALEAGRVPGNFDDLVGRLEARLAPLLRDNHLVIVHNVGSLHKNLVLTSALHRLWTKRAFPRLILWHHDLAWTSPQHMTRVHAGYPWDLLRTDWPGCTYVVVSQARLADLHSLISVPEDRTHVIPPGIDPDEVLDLSPETRAFFSRTGLRRARPLLILPARITRRKNIEFALQILAALRAEMPDAALLVTGPLGPHTPANRIYMEELLRLRRDLGVDRSAFFAAEAYPDGLPPNVLFEVYGAADGLLLTSREEGFGIPVLEAGMRALPVFLSDIPPLRAVGGEQALFFGIDDDARAIAQRVAKNLRLDPRYRLRARVAQEFTWEGIYKRYIRPLVEQS